MKAFPSEKKLYWLFRQGDKPVPNEVIEQGMDLRDYFAAKIAPQMNWEGTYAKEWEKEASDNLRAKRVYEIADAMMEARK